MCARYLYINGRLIRDDFGVVELPEFAPTYNAAPTQWMPVVLADGDRRVARLHRWGLVPPWAKDLSFATSAINARGETLAEKPAFRGAFAHRRCIVPADGFYEWHTEGRAKTPYLVRRKDGRRLAMAGLYEVWTGPDGEVPTFTIVTTEANGQMTFFHDRMPVILEEEDWEAWLASGHVPGPAVQGLVKPFAGELDLTPVNKGVGNPRLDGPELLVPDPPSQTTLF
ncbi:MAG: SOS response-associated peptidase [Fimbriimonadaceae bacterium]|nr:SOS response-associated peptidase [Fimbriimonadaceae bacterium]